MKFLCLTLIALSAILGQAAYPGPEVPTQATVGDTYPGLAAGALTHARLAELADGVLVKAGDVVVTRQDLAAVGSDAPPRVREQLTRNAFFVLEQISASKLLPSVARRESGSGGDLAGVSDRERVANYLKGILDQVQVTDAEVGVFYERNRSLFGGATLDQVKPQLAGYLREQKRQEALRGVIESIGRKVEVVVSASWTRAQSLLARDNPVDKVRWSGKPSMVDFGRGGCGPCDQMTPILETLKKKYEGKANVLFVNVGDEEILAMRYGIESIPVQVFFDKEGREVFRHTGFYPQDEIERRLAEMGAK